MDFSNLLLGVSVLLVIFSYFMILVIYFVNKKRTINDYSGFDAAKEVTSNYDEINIVNSNDVIFSEYDIKRNVIRLNNKNYDSNSYFDIAISSILAGYSLVNMENKSYFKFKSVIKKISYMGFVSLIGVILSYFINNTFDAKIGIIVLALLLFYQYMRYLINIEANVMISEVLDSSFYEKIGKVISGIINFNKLSFIVFLILIIRLVVIILGI